MAKANLLLLNPPEAPLERKEILTDWHPDGKYVFFVSKLSTMRLVTAQGRGNDLFEALESGRDMITPVGEEAIIASRETCIFAMSIDLAQRAPLEECYSAKDILRMMAEDKVLHQLTDLRDFIMPAVENDDDDDGQDGDSDPLAQSPKSQGE